MRWLICGSKQERRSSQGYAGPRYAGLGCVGLSLLFLQCAPGPLLTQTPGQSVQCNDGRRVLIDCSAFQSLRHEVVTANLGLAEYGLGLGGNYETTALQQVRESTEQLALHLESGCRDYNGCAISSDQYLSEKNTILNQLSRHLGLVQQQAKAVSPAVGEQIWVNALPVAAEQRLSLRYEVLTRDNATFRAHVSGTALKSGDEIKLRLEVSQPAYVYVILMLEGGSPLALFPNSHLGASNPVASGTTLELPPPDIRLVLDDKPGIEHLQLIAALERQPKLEAAMAELEVTARDVGEPANPEALLQQVGQLLCAGSASPSAAPQLGGTQVRCGKALTRGLKLIQGGGAALGQGITAVPNDDIVVLQHEIEHK